MIGKFKERPLLEGKNFKWSAALKERVSLYFYTFGPRRHICGALKKMYTVMGGYAIK